MPVKALPKDIVARLKKIGPELERLRRTTRNPRAPKEAWLLARMKNIDHRRGKNPRSQGERDIENWSGRVRQLRVSLRGTGVVIKKTHDATAWETISWIQRKVRIHNELPKLPEDYVLVEPKAYAISRSLIAMAKTRKPSVEEIIGLDEKQTERGRKFFAKLKAKHGITEHHLRYAMRILRDITGFKSSNVLLLGVKNGKFVFMPLLDMY